MEARVVTRDTLEFMKRKPSLTATSVLESPLLLLAFTNRHPL